MLITLLISWLPVVLMRAIIIDNPAPMSSIYQLRIWFYALLNCIGIWIYKLDLPTKTLEAKSQA